MYWNRQRRRVEMEDVKAIGGQNLGHRLVLKRTDHQISFLSWNFIWIVGLLYLFKTSWYGGQRCWVNVKAKSFVTEWVSQYIWVDIKCYYQEWVVFSSLVIPATGQWLGAVNLEQRRELAATPGAHSLSPNARAVHLFHYLARILNCNVCRKVFQGHWVYISYMWLHITKANDLTPCQ